MITKTISPRWQSDTYTAEIEPKKSIRLFGTFNNLTKGPRQYDITFKIGDKAEYDSYNLIYVGTIISIGEKTVTIEHHGERSRLNLENFASKNWDFDFDKIQAYNHEESYYI